MHNTIQNESYEHATWGVRNIHPEWALYVGDGHAPVGQAGYSSECNLILSGCTKLNNGSGQLRRKHMYNSYHNDIKSRMTGWGPEYSSGSASGSAAGHVVPGQGYPAGSGPHRLCHLRSYLFAYCASLGGSIQTTWTTGHTTGSSSITGVEYITYEAQFLPGAYFEPAPRKMGMGTTAGLGARPLGLLVPKPASQLGAGIKFYK